MAGSLLLRQLCAKLLFGKVITMFAWAKTVKKQYGL